MNTKYMVVIAAMAVMLIGATALATSESAFAGGHGHKKSYEKNQATSQVNECSNGFYPLNVGCQNTASQIQGDENEGALAANQAFPEVEHNTRSSSNQLFFDSLFS
jgi:outer membrane murein-binding lipoprotein Lpp